MIIRGISFLADTILLTITMTSQWARWRLKSPASRLFTQAFIQAQIKENIKAPPHWSLCGEFTGNRWIPRTKGQWRGKCFHLMTSSCVVQTLCKRIDEGSVIWFRTLITLHIHQFPRIYNIMKTNLASSPCAVKPLSGIEYVSVTYLLVCQ